MDWQTLSRHDHLQNPLTTMIQKISSLPEEHYQRIKEERDFIRFFCTLDCDWEIDTNIIIFMAKEAYKNHVDIQSFQQKIHKVKEYSHPDAKNSIFLWQNICSNTENVSIELKVSENQENAHPVQLEVYSPSQDIISFDLKQPDEEIDTLETCEFELESKKSDLAQTFRNVITDRERWKRYALTSWRWTKKHTNNGYQWLHKRDFFRPEIKKSSSYVWKKYLKGQHWVLHEQEIYFRLQNNKANTGYAGILAHKYIKIKLNIDKNRYKSLCSCNPSDFMRVLKGILSSSKLENEERAVLTQLKDSVLIHEKMLLQQETIFDAVNYGWVKLQRILKLISHITSKKKINLQIHHYLQLQIHPILANHHTEFRKNVEKQHNLNSLQKILSPYHLKRLSIFDHYPELKIIHKVKCITKEYLKRPDQFIIIMNKYFGTLGEVNIRKKLPEILCTNEINHYVFEKVSDDRYLQDTLKTLTSLQNKPKYKKVAQSLHQLIVTFTKNNGKFSYPDFRTSLNFIPTPLERKILSLVKRELQEQLNLRINTILGQEGRYVKRYDELLKELENAQYEDANVFLYKSTPKELAKRIQSISYNEENIDKTLKHILGDIPVPQSLLFLIKKARSAKEKGQEKNIPSCLRILSKMEDVVGRQEPIQMSKVLTSLFKQHGNINFSTSSEEISGYKIAREISLYYNNPQRTTFEMSLSVNEDIKSKLKILIDTHRKEQLRKIGN